MRNSLFSSKSMCKTITVDGEWKRVRGGKCGKPTSNSLSFSITKSVTTKHPVDVAFPHIARGCRPMLQLHYRRRSDGWTVCDMRRARWMCARGGGTGRRACGWAGASPSSPRSSLSHHAPRPRAAATHGACQEPEHGWTDWRATQYAAALTDHRRSTAHEDDAAAVLRTVPRCN